MPHRPLGLSILAFLVCGCAQQAPQEAPNADLVTYTEDREVCIDRNANRNAYFGDLHIHTAYSFDARPLGTRTTPADAYRFARGEAIPIPPYAEDGSVLMTQQITRPLDFAAVTDHSEFFGEMKLCFDEESEVYDVNSCRFLRGEGGEGLSPFIRIVISEDPERVVDVCGEDGSDCLEASLSLWRATQDMAEAAYDRTSACRFTTFVGYEYTGTPRSNNYHRNVIFRNDRVPEYAISYIESPTDVDLWEQLTEQCLEGVEGCDVLSIPHNSNLSSGAMFPSFISRFESGDTARGIAELRNAMEPVMEVFQHKGNSECFNGLPNILGAEDELCEQEQVRSVGREALSTAGEPNVVRFCEEGEIGMRGFARYGCISKNDFLRSVLLTGLQDQAVIGVNSYKMGVIASTDGHMSTAGDTHEHGWPGHLASETDFENRRTDQQGSPFGLKNNPGGLAGVWAVENSRDAIFESLRRKEVFGTTGTRIRPRLFAGWDFADNACELDDRAAHGYARGIPMGGDLSDGPGAAPQLFVSAAQDPDAAQLQKLQVIKGWIDDAGQANYKVFDVAGRENEEGEVDLQTGAWSGTGAADLCAVFEDPEFDPSEASYYYLRAVEVPTLRWSWAQCVALPAEERPDACDNDAPKTIQEMAWSSPIWYLPPGGD